jgi:TonB-dependent starch-binding outer membrane protein SusC
MFNPNPICMNMILQHLRTYIVLVVGLISSTLMAQGANRQEILETEVTLSLKGVTLKHALQELEAVAKVKFVYSRNYLNLDEKVTIEVNNKKLGQVLSDLLTPLEIKYAVHETENFVVLTQARMRGLTTPPADERTERFYAMTISGRVIDPEGHAMAGVNVVEKGTTNGTSTDAEGKYSLETGDSPVLIFSFIGYKSVEVAVAGRTVIDVTLEEDRSVLDPILVNAGYWKVSEREQTGSISRVTSEEIQRQPVGNPLAALIGRMPGVNIQQTSGLPGTQFSVQIRGRNSLRLEGNYPLYIIDGVPISPTSITSGYSPLGESSPLTGINPADIASIEVLKDADATAIYGTRGANGVVLITTKRGSPGKTKLDLNVYSGVGKVGHFMDLLNTEQYMAMRHEAHKNDGTPISFEEYDLLNVWDSTRYTDWQRTLIGGTANITNAQLSVSGGSENTSFSIGSGIYRETTVMPGDFANRKINTHLSLDHKSTNRKFEIGFQGTYLQDNNTLPYADLTSAALNLPPVAPRLYNEDGSINWAEGTWPNQFNPIAYTLIKYRGNSQNLLSNVRLSYELLPGLRFRSNLGYTSTRFDEVTSVPIESYDPAWGVTTGYSNFSNSKLSNWIAEPQLEYQKRADGNTLTVLFGSTFQELAQSGHTIRARGFTNNAFLGNIAAARTFSILGANYSQYKYNAFFGRINYALKDKYLFNLTGRRDGSSRFGPGKHFANFGAAAFAWIFSEESLLGAFDALSFGKLRVSYGITGNDQITDYGFMDTYLVTTYPYQGQNGLVPARLANPDYSWETTRKAEIAIETAFFNSRVSLVATYYNNNSSSQLVGYSLPRITGFSSIQYNLPAEVQNTGVELLVKTTNIVTPVFEWNTAITLTVPRNKLLSYPDIESSPDRYRWKVGEPLNKFIGLHNTGVDPQTGFYSYQDLNNNGSGTDFPDDLQSTKVVGQIMYGGITNSLRYRGFELETFIQFVKQNGRNGLSSLAVFYNPGGVSNQPVEVLNRWQKPGDVTNVQKFTNSGDGYYAYLAAGSADNSISNTSFVRLKNVSLSYSLPGTLLGNLRLQTARIYLQGQNLLTLTKFIGLDPEQGIIQNLPPLRFITAGIHLTF